MAHEAARTDQQHDDQEHEGNDVLVDRGDDQNGEGLDHADEKAAEDRAGDVAEAADDTGCPALQADHVGHGQADGEQRDGQDADWQREQWRYQQELDKYTQNEQQRQNAYNLAMTMLQLGQMPSAEMLAQAGISGEDAKRILAGVQAQSGGYSGGSGGSGGRSGGGSYSSGGGSGSGSGSGGGVTGGVDEDIPHLSVDELGTTARKYYLDIQRTLRYAKTADEAERAKTSLVSVMNRAYENNKLTLEELNTLLIELGYTGEG